MADGVHVLLLGRPGATVEDEEHGLVVLGASLIPNVRLVLGKQLRVQLDVAGLIYTVHVTETGGNGVVGANGRQRLLDGVDVFGLGVK